MTSARSTLQILLTVALLAASGLYLANIVFTLYWWGWTQPAYDQYMTYPLYLNNPFPMNVLSNENGHRPVFPALVRVAEITWFQSNQNLQRAVGALLMALCWTSLLWLALGSVNSNAANPVPDRSTPTLTKNNIVISTAIVLACTLALFWTANIRMQIHANEQLHVYGSILGLLGALAGLWQLQQTPNFRNFAMVCAGAIYATFSFGNGLVVFPTVLVLAFFLRLPLRWIAGLVSITVAIALLYARGLPGGNAPSLDWQYLPQGLLLMTNWLSAVWHGAWLQYASMDAPAIEYIGVNALNTAWVGHSAAGLAHTFNVSPNILALAVTRAIGAAAIVAVLLTLVRHIFAPIQSRLQMLALGLMLYGLGTGCLIVLFRVRYLLNDGMGQIFADRYLIWSCLWWLGIVLYVLSILKTNWTKWLVGVCGLLLAWILAFSSYYHLTWGRILHNQLNLQALSLRLGLVDEVFGATVTTVSMPATIAVFDLLRRNKLAQFSTPLLQPSAVPPNLAPKSTDSTHWRVTSLKLSSRFDAKKYMAPVWEFEGGLLEAEAHQSPYEFIVLDASGNLCGAAIQFDAKLPRYFRNGPLIFSGYYTCAAKPEMSSIYARSETGEWTNIGALKISP